MYKYCPYCSDKLSDNAVSKSIQMCNSCKKYIYHHTPQTAASILLNPDGEMLLVKRKKNPFKHLWSLPAGFVEYGENPVSAAIRELKEESGMDAEYDEIVGVYLADDHPQTYSILTVIKVKNISGKLKPNDDAVEAKYFDINNLPEMAFQAQVKAIKDL